MRRISSYTDDDHARMRLLSLFTILSLLIDRRLFGISGYGIPQTHRQFEHYHCRLLCVFIMFVPVMKRQLLSIGLLLILFNPLMLKVGVFCHWKYNQRIIAQTLCVNKNRPELHCKGKCQLKKDLALIANQKNKENDSTLPPHIFKNLKIDQFLPSRKVVLPFEVTGLSFFKTPLYKYSNFFYTNPFFISIFHPPELFA